MSMKEAADTILQSQVKPDGSYDTLATVLRTDGDTVWVHIDGGAPETPCKKTVECKAGESVMVRISGGSAWITGNHTSPSTDDTEAEKAKEEARKAAGTATSFITDSDNGIFVHPKNSTQRGVRVTDVVDIVRDGKTVAEFGEEIRLGEDSNYSILVRSDGIVFIDEMGEAVGQLYRNESGGLALRDLDSMMSLVLNAPVVGIVSDRGSGIRIYNNKAHIDFPLVVDGAITADSETPIISISTTTGVLDSYTIRKFGNIVFLKLTVYNNSSVASAGNIFTGTINTTGLRPVDVATGAGYWGGHAVGILISAAGNITVRNASSSAFTPNSSNKTNISITYMVG